MLSVSASIPIKMQVALPQVLVPKNASGAPNSVGAQKC